LLNIKDLQETGAILGHPEEIMTGKIGVEECRVTHTETADRPRKQCKREVYPETNINAVGDVTVVIKLIRTEC
jgi:hypothetical protein